MKLYNLTEAPLDMQNPVDRELAKTSKDIDKDGSMDQNDIDSQMDDENTPDTPMPDDDPDDDPNTDNENTKAKTTPVDDKLLSIVRNHDYITRYDHDIDKPSHPNNIMTLDMSGLSQLRNRIRAYIDRIGIEDKVGMYANTDLKAAQDMLSFVDTVMAFDKNKVKQTSAKKSNKAKFNRMKPPKTHAGKKFKAKKHK